MPKLGLLLVVLLLTWASDALANDNELIASAAQQIRINFPERTGKVIALESHWGSSPSLICQHEVAIGAQRKTLKFFIEHLMKDSSGGIGKYSKEYLVREENSLLASQIRMPDLANRAKVILMESHWPIFKNQKNSETLDTLAFAIGCTIGVEGMESVSSQDFENALVVESNEANELVVVHSPSRSKFVFSKIEPRKLRLEKVIYEVGNKRDSGPDVFVGVTLNIKHRAEDGSVQSYSARLNSAKAIENNFSIVSISDEIDSNYLSQFTHHEVENGVLIADELNRFRTMQYHDGKALFAIDPNAETVVQSILGEKDVSEKQNDSDLFVRHPYLRSTGSAAHCGIYSLAIAAAKLNKNLPMEELVLSDYYTAPIGSDANQLAAAANHYGLVATTFANTNLSFLGQLESPCLLHYGNSHQAEGTSHWVALLSVNEDGSCNVVDLPRGNETLTESDLLTYWDGTAVVISDHEIPYHKNLFLRGRIIWHGALFAFAVGLVWLPIRRNQGLARSSFKQAMALVLISTGLAIFWSTFSSISFANNPASVGIVKGKVPSESRLPELTDTKTLQQDGIILVDARLPSSFLRGHIPNAINIPVDSSLGELRAGVEKIAPQSEVVVYCQSDACVWGHAVGNRLLAMGHKNVSVYKPGWLGYRKSKAK